MATAAGRIAIAAQFLPLTIWAGNASEIGFPDGLLVWTSIVIAAGLLLWWALRRLHLDAGGAGTVCFWAVLGVSTLGLRSPHVSGGAPTLLFALAVVCVLAYRLRDLAPFQWFDSWAVLFVAISPVAFALHAQLTAPGGTAAHIDAPMAHLGERPDVVMVVFDAHASLDVLESHYGIDTADTYAEWDDLGAMVRNGMQANYTLTHLSLASMLQMGYPYADGDQIRERDWNGLLGTISGDNNLVHTFKDQGYRFHMVESGWPGFHCDRVVDVCARGPWPGEPTAMAMRRSLLRDMIPERWADPAARGALNSIRWLRDELPSIVQNDSADLVLAHLMLPHPPLRLGDDCSYERRPGLGGTTVASPSFTKEEVDRRVSAYVEATTCVRQVVTELLTAVDDDAVLVAFGDHGPDSRAQLHRLPERWTSDDLEERLGVLFVTNSRCAIDGLHSLVNVGRWLVACLSDETPDYLDDRFFAAIGARRNIGEDPEPLLEVTPALVGDSE